ncbi:MAG TPA: hypothetical protein VGG78_04205, partial [Gemmatimonadaceae bacterium]
MRARTLLTIALVALLVPALLPAQTIAIVGAKIYPVSGPAIEHGTVLMRDGRIVSVGTDVAVPADAQRIDATGKIVTPGLVNAATQIGIVEIGAVGTTREGTARGHEGIAAAFQPWLGLNNSSVLISPARASGVTTVLVTPSGGRIAGQAAAIHLVPGT